MLRAAALARGVKQREGMSTAVTVVSSSLLPEIQWSARAIRTETLGVRKRDGTYGAAK